MQIAPLAGSMQPSVVDTCKTIATALVQEMRADLSTDPLAPGSDGALWRTQLCSASAALLTTTAGG